MKRAITAEEAFIDAVANNNTSKESIKAKAQKEPFFCFILSCRSRTNRFWLEMYFQNLH